MTFPVKTITRSALLSGQSNGKLDPSILESTPGQAGGATVILIKPAARSWRALVAAAKAAGHILKAASVADSYRLYEIQERIFRERYQTTPIRTTDTKQWQGRTWYKKPGVAVAAAPGTSNHGWAQAVDTGEERDGDAGAEAFDDPTLRWIIDHAQTYGWSHELQTEPWHLHYFAGDQIPAAVLAFERGQTPHEGADDMTPEQAKKLDEVHAALIGKNSGLYAVLSAVRGVRAVADRIAKKLGA